MVVKSSFYGDRQQQLQRRFILFLLLLCVFSWLAIAWLYFYSPLINSSCSKVQLPSPEKLVYQTDNLCRQNDPSTSLPHLEYTDHHQQSDVSCSNSSTLAVPSSPSTNSTLNHLIFSLWWPPAVASGQPQLVEKARIHRKWLIRGLLTQTAFEAPPRQSSFPFDITFPDELYDRLTSLMPNLAGYQDDQRYWSQVYNAWGRHSNFTPSDYLKNCVDLYLSPKLNLTTWQRTSMRRPSDSHGYRWNDFLAGFPARDSVQLICQIDNGRNGTLGTGKQYLREIQLCVDQKLQLSSPRHCYYTDNICDRCRPIYFSSTLI